MMDSPLSEITLRKYERPYQSDKRGLVRKVCLSLGLLQPGDSRDIVVDILLVLLRAREDKKELELEKIKEQAIEARKLASLEIKGIADSNIRRQLKRLKDNMIIESSVNKYYLSENASLKEIFEKRFEKFIIPQTIERIKEYLDELEK